MITDEIVEAIDMLIELCSNDQQVKGMNLIREMLCDFDDLQWMQMDQSERNKWLEQYLYNGGNYVNSSCEKEIELHNDHK